MKINQMPDIFIEQYLLGELPENLRKEMEKHIQADSGLRNRVLELKKSNEEILSAYPAGIQARAINEKLKEKINILRSAEYNNTADNKREHKFRFPTGAAGALKNLYTNITKLTDRRYVLAAASAAAMAVVVIFTLPGIININSVITPGDSTVRIKGLESKLLLFRVRGKEVEELKNLDKARSGDIIQAGYIAAGKFTHGIILSIDGRGTVTIHYPDGGASGDRLVTNRQTLLNKSYELDDSPSFERFIMILSADPLNTAAVTEKAKMLAGNSESSLNGLINAGDGSVEYSIILKKTE